ncbi:L,D-carboxypeptidase A [compost metagenome]
MTGEEKIALNGRIIGGCLDVLINLVGTKYDNVKNFVNKYKDDGIIWYLESYDLSGEQLVRALWQLKEAGWFENVKGFIFGRPAMYSSCYDLDYYECIKRVLLELNVPIIVDACIGHKPPQFTIINGAIANIESSNSKGKISFDKM